MVVARDTTMDPSSPSELGRGRMAPLGRNVGVPQRGMRPAGVIGPARQVAPVGVLDVKRKSAVRPLSAEAIELPPTLGPKIDVITGQETMSSGAGVIVSVSPSHIRYNRTDLCLVLSDGIDQAPRIKTVPDFI